MFSFGCRLDFFQHSVDVQFLRCEKFVEWVLLVLDFPFIDFFISGKSHDVRNVSIKKNWVFQWKTPNIFWSPLLRLIDRKNCSAAVSSCEFSSSCFTKKKFTPVVFPHSLLAPAISIFFSSNFLLSFVAFKVCLHGSVVSECDINCRVIGL